MQSYLEMNLINTIIVLGLFSLTTAFASEQSLQDPNLKNKFSNIFGELQTSNKGACKTDNKSERSCLMKDVDCDKITKKPDNQFQNPLEGQNFDSIHKTLTTSGFDQTQASFMVSAISQGHGHAFLNPPKNFEISRDQNRSRESYLKKTKIKNKDGQEKSLYEINSLYEKKISEEGKSLITADLQSRYQNPEKFGGKAVALSLNQKQDPEKFKEGYQKANATFEKVRSLMLKQFAGNPAAKMFETVKFVKADDMMKAEACQLNISPAVYLAGMNTVALCPKYFDYPEEVLVQILAHELSHSVDLCASFTGLVSWNKKEIIENTNKDKSFMNSLSKGENGYLSLYLMGEETGISNAAPEEFSASNKMGPGGPSGEVVKGPEYTGSMKSKLVKQGILKEVIPGFKNAEEFKKNSIGYEVMKCHEGSAKFDKLLKKNIQPETNLFCNTENKGHSEVFCDYVSAKILGAYLEEKVAKETNTEQVYQNVISYHAQNYCEQTAQGKRPPKNDADLTHLSDQVRIEDIILGNQQVRSLLNCSDKPKKKRCSI
jgi:hypothetical protein